MTRYLLHTLDAFMGKAAAPFDPAGRRRRTAATRALPILIRSTVVRYWAAPQRTSSHTTGDPPRVSGRPGTKTRFSRPHAPEEM